MADHVGGVGGRDIEDALPALDPDLALFRNDGPRFYLVDVEVHLGAQVDVGPRCDRDHARGSNVNVLSVVDLNSRHKDILADRNLFTGLVRERGAGLDGYHAPAHRLDLVQVLRVIRVGRVAPNQNKHARFKGSGISPVVHPGASVCPGQGACRGIDIHGCLRLNPPRIQDHRRDRHLAVGFRGKFGALQRNRICRDRGDLVELAVVRGVRRVPVHADVETSLEADPASAILPCDRVARHIVVRKIHGNRYRIIRQVEYIVPFSRCQGHPFVVR